MAEKNVVLILTEELDPHADLMVAALREQAPEVEVVRFHTDLFPEQAHLDVRLSDDRFSAQLSFYNRTVDLTRVRSVWVRRPRPPILHTSISEQYRKWSLAEAEQALQGVWHALGAFVVNPMAANRVASHKVLQLRVASELGFMISPTQVTNVPDAARAFFTEHAGEVIIKPFSQPMIVNRMDAPRILYAQKVSAESILGEAGERVRHVPVQLQRLVKKVCDVRVTVIGNQSFAAEIKGHGDHVDIRRWTETNPEYAIHELPPEIEAKCYELIRRLGLYYGAIDLLLTENGEYLFLEVNPSGQFYWIERHTEMPMLQTLANLLVQGGLESEAKSCLRT